MRNIIFHANRARNDTMMGSRLQGGIRHETHMDHAVTRMQAAHGSVSRSALVAWRRLSPAPHQHQQVLQSRWSGRACVGSGRPHTAQCRRCGPGEGTRRSRVSPIMGWPPSARRGAGPPPHHPSRPLDALPQECQLWGSVAVAGFECRHSAQRTDEKNLESLRGSLTKLTKGGLLSVLSVPW